MVVTVRSVIVLTLSICAKYISDFKFRLSKEY